MALAKAIEVVRFGGARLRETYERHERYFPAVSLFAGTLLDVLTLGRIDHVSNLIQLAAYLMIAGVFLFIDVRETEAPVIPPAFAIRWWRYREEVIHFLLGGLLSAFVIFYFKSSSVLGSGVFFVVVAAALVGNEFSELRRYGVAIRTVLYTMCLVSYFTCVTPVWLGYIGVIPFLIALLVAGLLIAGMAWGLRRCMEDQQLIRKRFVVPAAATLLGFVLFYATKLIPPVPLALNHIGIYHDVQRIQGGYEVTWHRPSWKFWQNGDQSFAWRAGEKVWVFFSVFSPGGFREQLKIRWLYQDAVRGWQPADAVPVGISGGREEGYRGFAYKQNLRPGDWRVQVETSDGREVGRIYFTVFEDASPPAKVTRRRF